jgi:hypothetical protein
MKSLVRRLVLVCPILAALGLLYAPVFRSHANGYKLARRLNFPLENPLYRNGYDWWWRSFVAQDPETGALKPFFVEFFVINPGLGGDEAPVLGQAPENRARKIKPSYAKVVAGTWGEKSSIQVHNYFPLKQFSAATDRLDVRIGDNILSETRLKASVRMSEAQAAAHPELLSDAGALSFDLAIKKQLSYFVGYPASDLFTNLNALEMWWTIPGMKSYFSGELRLNGKRYVVVPELSYGYEDKNWGGDYTNPWIWLNCNRFVSRATGKVLERTSLVVGGGAPRLFGLSLGERALVVFHHEGELFEVNFSKLVHAGEEEVKIEESASDIRWKIQARNGRRKIVVDFSAPKSKMMLIRYENPKGEVNHRHLWNTGFAQGTVEIYSLGSNGAWTLVDTLSGSFGGGESGRYDMPNTAAAAGGT